MFVQFLFSGYSTLECSVTMTITACVSVVSVEQLNLETSQSKFRFQSSSHLLATHTLGSLSLAASFCWMMTGILWSEDCIYFVSLVLQTLPRL